MKKNMSKKAIQRRRETEERARRAREAESLAAERERRAELEQRLAAGRAQMLEERRRARLREPGPIPEALGLEGPDAETMRQRVLDRLPTIPELLPLEPRPRAAPPWRQGALRAMALPYLLLGGMAGRARDPDKG